MANPKLKSVTKTPQDANVIARRKPAGAVRTAYSLAEREEIFRRFSVQPMDGPDRISNTEWAIAFCLAHPQWQLSLQTHKITGIR